MVRGGTHLHSFLIPFNFEEIQDIYITYSQQGKVILTKATDDCVYNETNKCVQTHLSQADTLSFLKPGMNALPDESLVLIQIRLKLKDNVVCVSYPIKERLFDVAKEGEI